MKASANSSSTPGRTTTFARAQPPDHFGLTGRSVELDSRVNAVRGDIADIALAGVLFAPHYSAPLARGCAPRATPVRAAPDHDAELISELLHGETFETLDFDSRWAWGFCGHDHYVGYVERGALGAPARATWRVVVPEAHGLSMGSRIAALDTEFGTLARTDVVGVDHRADAVALAESLLGTPYLLGGRSARGIDCSGLVQVTLGLAGTSAPRDSDQQAASLGQALAPGAPLHRGDIVCFPGHVGMMVDGERLIHATGFHRQVVIEALDAVVARILGGDHAAIHVRRV